MNFQPNLSKQTIAIQKLSSEWEECGAFSVKHAKESGKDCGNRRILGKMTVINLLTPSGFEKATF
jgi:hypothetical protein